MNPRSTDCEADALTTTPSRRFFSIANLCTWFDWFSKSTDRSKNNVMSQYDLTSTSSSAQVTY